MKIPHKAISLPTQVMGSVRARKVKEASKLSLLDEMVVTARRLKALQTNPSDAIRRKAEFELFHLNQEISNLLGAQTQ